MQGTFVVAHLKRLTLYITTLSTHCYLQLRAIYVFIVQGPLCRLSSAFQANPGVSGTVFSKVWLSENGPKNVNETLEKSFQAIPNDSK